MAHYKINQQIKIYRLYITILLIVLIALGAGFYVRHYNQSVVPKNILNQLNFSVFYPKQSSQIKIETNSYKYSKQLGQLSFIILYDNRSLTFAEQSSPDSFAADPSFYPKFTSSLNGYATFDTVNGTASLTVPTEVKHEVGVMNAKGTLMFAQSTTGNLSENAWKQLFNSLVYVQPN